MDKISITICGDGGCGMLLLLSPGNILTPWFGAMFPGFARSRSDQIGMQANPPSPCGWSVVNGFTSEEPPWIDLEYFNTNLSQFLDMIQLSVRSIARPFRCHSNSNRAQRIPTPLPATSMATHTFFPSPIPQARRSIVGYGLPRPWTRTPSS